MDKIQANRCYLRFSDENAHDNAMAGIGQLRAVGRSNAVREAFTRDQISAKLEMLTRASLASLIALYPMLRHKYCFLTSQGRANIW